VHNFPFLDGERIVGCLPTEDKFNTQLHKFEFPVRFQSFLAKNKQITDVKDLLEIPIEIIKKNKNIGRITIDKAQDTIREFLTSNNEEFIVPTITEASENNNYCKKYDEIIVNRIISLLGERNSKLFLMRYYYETPSKLTLEEIGESFGLTKQRAQQIIDRDEKRISRHGSIFKELIKLVKSGSVVTNNKIIVKTLIEANLWSPKNAKFLKAIGTCQYF
jgi:hypothetical protein